MSSEATTTPGAVTPSAPVPVFPRKLPTTASVWRQRGRLPLMIAVGVVAVVGVAGVVLIAASAGDAEGTGLSILFAMIPLPVLWACYWWLDRYEPEPRRYKLGAFVWGGVVAAGIALGLEVLAAHVLDAGDDVLATFIAPPIEESAKGLLLFVTFLRARRVIDGFVDGLVYAGIVGIGFAFAENIGYYAAAYLGSPDIKIAGAGGATGTFVVRGIFSPFAHPLFTSALGIGIGLAVTQRSRWAKTALVVLGLAAAMCLHGAWNGSLAYGGTTDDGVPVVFFLAYLGLGALLVLLGTFAIVIRARQVRTLEKSLAYTARRGWIHPDEVPYLSRFAYRSTARRYARQHYGKQAATVVKRYQQLATEMAFLHDAVMTGRRKPHGVERTHALLDAMNELRPWVRLPPPVHTHRF